MQWVENKPLGLCWGLYIHFRIFHVVLLWFCTFIIFLYSFTLQQAVKASTVLNHHYLLLLTLSSLLQPDLSWCRRGSFSCLDSRSQCVTKQMCLWIFVWMSIYFIKSGDTNIINVLLYCRSNWFCINCDNTQKCWHPGEQWFNWEAFVTWLN